jgi:hypothetical protein
MIPYHELFERLIQLRKRDIHASIQNMTNGIDCNKNQWLISLEFGDGERYAEGYSKSIELAFNRAINMWNEQYPNYKITFDNI